MAAAENTALTAPALCRSLGRGFGPLAALYILMLPVTQASLDVPALQPWFDALNTGDSLTDEIGGHGGGYYEHLMDADPANAQLWETLNRRPMPTAYEGNDPVRPVKDLRFREYLPNVRLAAYDTEFATNRWGMRGPDYNPVKPAGTVRIAVLGSSHVMGWGLPVERVFASIIERRLNSEGPGAGRTRYEVLNFAVNGLSPLGETSAFPVRVAAFHPDIVLLVTHTIDLTWNARDLVRAEREHLRLDDPFLTGLLSEARITDRTHAVIAGRRLVPYREALAEWAYRRIAEQARAAGAKPVALFLPIPDDLPMNAAAAQPQVRAIAGAGFDLIDFTHLYDGRAAASLRLPEPLHHSNATAHALVADALYQRLVSDATIDLPTLAERVHANAPSIQAATH